MKTSLSDDSRLGTLVSSKPLKMLPLGVVIALLACGPALARSDPLSDLRAQDERLLRVGEPIMAANAPLCDRTMPDLGVALQSSDQYPATGGPPFSAPVAFAAVLPQSAAAQAGIQRDDGLLAIDGTPVTKRPELQGSPLRDSAFAALAEHPAGTALQLTVVRAGQQRTVDLAWLAPNGSIQAALITGVLGILDVLGAVVTVGLARFGARPSVRAAGALTLPPDLRTALDDRAAATGRTSADLLAEAVRSYLRD